LRAREGAGGWRANLVRWGGVALVAAGVLGLVASALFVVAVLRAPAETFSYAYERFYMAASLLQYSPRWALLCVGLAGFYFALDGAPEPIRRLASTGVVLAPLGLVFPSALLLGWALGSQDIYSASSGPPFYETFYFILFWVLPGAGVALCGVAAYWVRGLGRWRFLLLAISVLDSPLLYSLAFVLVSNAAERPFFPYTDTRWMEYSLQAQVALASVGCVVFGRLLYGSRDREAEIIAKERRVLAEGNRRKARRLYEAAWGKGDPTVVDELVAEHFFDHERHRHGREGFKKSLSELHRAFPDLTLSIEEQTAQDDTVTTRCTLSGTDSGGVFWYPPTHRQATFTGNYTDRFWNGKMVEHYGGVDKVALMKQLGLRSFTGV
jgi:predicted ester cyclase